MNMQLVAFSLPVHSYIVAHINCQEAGSMKSALHFYIRLKLKPPLYGINKIDRLKIGIFKSCYWFLISSHCSLLVCLNSVKSEAFTVGLQ